MYSKATVNLTGKIVSSTLRHCLSTIQLSYESYDQHEFQPGTKLFHELVNIASPTYQNPYETILHAVHASNKLYVLHSEMQYGAIVNCSLMQFGQEVTLLGNDRKIPVAYLNLAIANEKFKNTGLIKKLFENLYRELQERKRRQPQLPSLIYFVTATPSIIHQTDKVFLNMVPSINDYNRTIFTDQEWHIANELRKLRNWPLAVRSLNANPFVLKGIMKPRYTTDERRRIEKIVKKVNFTVFEDLGIDESNGDRLLRFAYI